MRRAIGDLGVVKSDLIHILRDHSNHRSVPHPPQPCPIYIENYLNFPASKLNCFPPYNILSVYFTLVEIIKNPLT